MKLKQYAIALMLGLFSVNAAEASGRHGHSFDKENDSSQGNIKDSDDCSSQNNKVLANCQDKVDTLHEVGDSKLERMGLGLHQPTHTVKEAIDYIGENCILPNGKIISEIKPKDVKVKCPYHSENDQCVQSCKTDGDIASHAHKKTINDNDSQSKLIHISATDKKIIDCNAIKDTELCEKEVNACRLEEGICLFGPKMMIKQALEENSQLKKHTNSYHERLVEGTIKVLGQLFTMDNKIVATKDILYAIKYADPNIAKAIKTKAEAIKKEAKENGIKLPPHYLESLSNNLQ